MLSIKDIPNILFKSQLTTLGCAVLLSTFPVSAFVQSAQAALKNAPSLTGRCYSGNRQWLVSFNCYFPLQNGTSYINLTRLTNTGGSGADVWFCDGNRAAQPNANLGAYCYKFILNINQSAKNPLGPKKPTDIYIKVHNSNWYTDFRLD